MRPVRLPSIVAVALAALDAGCSTPSPGGGASPATLAGTRWQLVALESVASDDPPARPSDRSRYTVAFGADGRAAWQLDCNRGLSTWQAVPNADGRSGALELGGLATTRAMCPPDSLAPRLAKLLPYVRSYSIRDGRLRLSLMADAGSVAWEPAP